MSGYSVDLEQLDALIARMGSFEHALEGIHDEVESRMRQLRVRWTGVAADEHQQAHTEWAAGSSEARAALREIRVAVTTAHANYAEALRANAATWSP